MEENGKDQNGAYEKPGAERKRVKQTSLKRKTGTSLNA